MMNSSDWEKGGPETDCRGVEMTQHCHSKGLLAIASVALLAGTLMLSNHEALARGAAVWRRPRGELRWSWLPRQCFRRRFRFRRRS